ncbi:MAG: caspase family protein [Gammaproteobacteria bacterium]|jgi:hypothetical protein
MPKIFNKRRGYNIREEGTSVKAVVVGINYRGTRNQLGGCINDALATQRNILSEYPNASIELMTDDTPNKPTRNNILDRLRNLVDNAQSGDTLMFHYSGHGSQVDDYDGDEEDGMDETICPIDFMTPRVINVQGTQLRVDSQITDDEIHEIISNTPKGAKFLMLSDSCHSGTIGDLKNDFTHYHGPSEWQDDMQSPQFGQPQSTQPSVLKTITSDTYWVYAKYSKELWLTPTNDLLYAKFSDNKYVIKNTDYVPPQLLDSSKKMVKAKTTFTQLANGQYEVSCSELGISGLVTTSRQRALNRASNFEGNVQLQFNPSAPAADAFSISTGIKYSYDPDTGNHNHYSGGKKRSLNMRSPSGCNGGELRIISGCEENQTSADTGTNGACTNAFWKAVQTMGGLRQFFPKIFSHNVEDLRAVQDAINKNLAGYTQHSVVSWDHAAHASRNIGIGVPQQLPLPTVQPTYAPLYANTYYPASYRGLFGHNAEAVEQPQYTSLYSMMSGGHPVSYNRGYYPRTRYTY